jgi:hypothetical protein
MADSAEPAPETAPAGDGEPDDGGEIDWGVVARETRIMLQLNPQGRASEQQAEESTEEA